MSTTELDSEVSEVEAVEMGEEAVGDEWLVEVLDEAVEVGGADSDEAAAIAHYGQQTSGRGGHDRCRGWE